MRRRAESRQETFRKQLLAWFDREGRALPWRQTRDPYRIWVSEVMLQQTQVAKVVAYYERFLTAYPTVKTLAAAPVDEVLRLWEGLGYYARAQQLQRAAQIVAETHGGNLPRTAEELRRLPGVGPYTAGAILSIAFDRPVPALDTNALRVLSRVFWLFEAESEGARRRAAETTGAAVMSHERPGDHNQALMDLATLVCTVRQPRCGQCPVAEVCEARRRGETETKGRVKRPEAERVEAVAALVWRGDRLLLAQRPLQGVWRGLWELPNCEWTTGEDPREMLRRQVRESLGVEIEVGAAVHRLRHSVMNRRITLTFHECRLVSGRVRCREHQGARWVRRAELERYALPAPHRRTLAAVPAANVRDGNGENRKSKMGTANDNGQTANGGRHPHPQGCRAPLPLSQALADERGGEGGETADDARRGAGARETADG